MEYSKKNTRFLGFAEMYNKYRPKPPESIIKLALDLIETPNPDIVLDLGCGTGISTRPFIGRAKRIVGIDSSSDMLKIAKSYDSKGIEYINEEAEKTSLLDESVNIITSSSAVHWIDPKKLLKEVNRILKSKGVFLIYGHYYPVYSNSYKLTKLHEKWRKNLDFLEYEVENQKQKPYLLKDIKKVLEQSDAFEYTRNLYIHNELKWNSEQVLGFIEAHAGINFLKEKEYSDDKLLINEYKEELSKYGDDFIFHVIFTYSIWFGIKR